MTEELLRKVLQEEFVNDMKFSGWCRNVYGDTVKIEEILEDELNKITVSEPQSPAAPKQKMIVARVKMKESWKNYEEFACKRWIVWKEIVNQIEKANLGNLEKEGSSAVIVNSNNKKISACCIHFNKTIEEIGKDTNTETIRNGMLSAFKLFGVQLLVVLYNYDVVKSIFPETKAEGGPFFQDLFAVSPKSSSENKNRIVIVSKEPASGYAHHMSGGSSFLAAYPQILLEK